MARDGGMFGINYGRPEDGIKRLTRDMQNNTIVAGGSKEAHERLVDTTKRINSELKRRGETLGSVHPQEFVEIVQRITEET